MTVRVASAADLPAVLALWDAFEAEVPPPDDLPVERARELAEIHEIVESGLAFLAEDGTAGAVGVALGRVLGPGLGRLTDLYVAPGARRTGVARALVAELAEALEARGVARLDLEVLTTNAEARAVYQRWGFVEHVVQLSVPLEALRTRLDPGTPHAVSFASLHVQTDDAGAVERAATAFAPRIASTGWRIEGPRDGWTTIYDEVIDRDPTALVRYAREVSSRLGTIVIALSLEVDQVVRLVALERGGIVDEYLSVPEFYGPLPPGDVIGLAANPTVLHRLTGANPGQVRAVARTAATPSELPPPRELLAAIADVLGLQGAAHGYTVAE